MNKVSFFIVVLKCDKVNILKGGFRSKWMYRIMKLVSLTTECTEVAQRARRHGGE